MIIFISWCIQTFHALLYGQFIILSFHHKFLFQVNILLVGKSFTIIFKQKRICFCIAVINVQFYLFYFFFAYILHHRVFWYYRTGFYKNRYRIQRCKHNHFFTTLHYFIIPEIVPFTFRQIYLTAFLPGLQYRAYQYFIAIGKFILPEMICWFILLLQNYRP